MPTINYIALEELQSELEKNIKKSILFGLYTGPLLTIFFITIRTTKTSFGSITVDGIIAFLFFSIFFSALLSLPYYFLRKKKLEVSALKKFSEQNNFTYKTSPREDIVHSQLFTMGDKKRFSYVIESQQTNLPFSFLKFEYALIRSRYKNKRTEIYYEWYPFLVLIYELRKAVPNIYIHTLNGAMDELFTENQKINLNVRTEYEKNHSVYAPKQYEIEALQILDSTFIELLSEQIPNGDIEFYDSKMFIYCPLPKQSKGNYISEIRRILSLYSSLNQPLLKKINTFSFTQVGDFSTTLRLDTLSLLTKNTLLSRLLFSELGLVLLFAIVIAGIEFLTR